VHIFWLTCKKNKLYQLYEIKQFIEKKNIILLIKPARKKKKKKKKKKNHGSATDLAAIFQLPGLWPGP
jgi:hypothetical protein